MLINSQGEQTSTKSCPPQSNYPPKVTFEKRPTSQNKPFPSRLQATVLLVCYLCATATMKILNQDVCVLIAGMSTPATGAITTSSPQQAS